MSNGVYVDDWEKHAELVRAILKVFKRWNITFDYGIWAPSVWTELKKESMALKALIHVTMEAQALQAWNCDGGFVEFRKGLDAVASARNCYWEMGYHWSIHMFPLPTLPANPK